MNFEKYINLRLPYYLDILFLVESDLIFLKKKHNAEGVEGVDFFLRWHFFQFDHWPKPSKVRGNIWPAILEKGQPSYQILIPRLLRNSRQHFIARHFLWAHKSLSCTSSTVSASLRPSLRRRFSVSNLSQCHIHCFKHTHIASSTILL
jgi:hypothetical protein